MKHGKLLVGVMILGLALSHCGNSDSASNGGTDNNDNPDVVDNITVHYQFSGIALLTKAKSVTPAQTLSSSSAILSFNNAIGTAIIQPTGSFKSVCTRSDVDTGTSTDVPDPSTTPPVDTKTISAGTAIVTDSQSVQLANITPTITSAGVFYSPNNDILSHDLLIYGNPYTISMAGATNTDPAVIVPSFNATLFVADPGTVSIASNAVENLVINGTPLVALADVKNNFTWSKMGNIRSPTESGSNFGIQYVQFINAADTSRSVACIFTPDQTNLQSALANSASDVFDILTGSQSLNIILAQVNTVNVTPKSSDSAQGFVPYYAETIQTFSSVNLVQ